LKYVRTCADCQPEPEDGTVSKDGSSKAGYRRVLEGKGSIKSGYGHACTHLPVRVHENFVSHGHIQLIMKNGVAVSKKVPAKAFISSVLTAPCCIAWK
jgi:hypothetical protein